MTRFLFTSKSKNSYYTFLKRSVHPENEKTLTTTRPSGIRDLRIPAMDDFSLTGTAYEPDAPTDRAVLITCGTGIRRRYYDKFARFLQEQGFYVVTFDYRGIGDSRPPTLRGFSARMHEWGREDMAGALRWIAQTVQPAKLFIVGHSAGAQFIGLAPNCNLVEAVVMVAPPHGYWKHWSPLKRPVLIVFWRVVMPLLARGLGYFPSKVFRLGESLPRDVALEWASWCCHPGYLFGSGDTLDLSRYPTLTVPTLAYSFADDVFAPKPAVEALLREYPGAEIDYKHLAPENIGVKHIGHFGFFRDRFRDTLWRETADWLRQR